MDNQPKLKLKVKKVPPGLNAWASWSMSHMEENRPKLRQRLLKQGKYYQKLRADGQRASEMFRSLLDQGYDHLQAREVVLHELILLPDIGEEEEDQQEPEEASKETQSPD